MIEAVTDEGCFPNDRNPSRDAAAAEHTLNVSVITLDGELLIVVPVSARSSVWELKGLIQKSILGRSVKATWMTLVLGTRVLADAASLHDAGVVDGTTLSIILCPKYRLLVCTFWGDLELWNQEGKLEGTFLTTRYVVPFVGFSPDNTFVVAGDGPCAKLWRVGTQKLHFILKHDVHVLSAAFNPTGTAVLTTSVKNDAKVWSISSGQCVNIAQLPPLGHTVAAFTAHGAMLLYTGHGAIALWNVETGTCVWEYRHRYLSFHQPKSACFSACGDWFFTISGPCNLPGNAMDVWSVSRCSHYWQFKEPNAEITYGSFSPDGWRVVTVSSRKTARVWSLARDWASWAFHHEGSIESAAFAPDGLQVVTISCGYVWLWIADGQTLGRRLPHSRVSIALFSPDSRCVLLSGRDGVRMWSANGKEPCWANADESLRAVAFSH